MRLNSKHILIILLITATAFFSLNKGNQIRQEEENSFTLLGTKKDDFFTIDASNTDYLTATAGTDFSVTVESDQLFEAYSEYFVLVTLEVITFGIDVDRLYDITVDLSLVWSGGSWDSTIRSIPEINTEGGSNSATIGITLNEGDFGSLTDNQEVVMTLYYHLVLWEGVIGWFDEISSGTLEVFPITYRNTPITPVDGIYDVVLPPVYSDLETKMGLSVRTNADWITDKSFTVSVTFSAEEFPWDVDRFHTIQFQLQFKAAGYTYTSPTTVDLAIALGESYTYDFYKEFLPTDFGGLAIDEEIDVQIWYEMYYKEGVILAIDPEYTIGPRYIFDVTLTNEAAESQSGIKGTHDVTLNTSIILTHMASKSWYKDLPNTYLNFTLFFAFNIYIEITNDLVLESYTEEELSSMNPYDLYIVLKEEALDISIGAKPTIGCIINWINKTSMAEYTFEILDLPVPTMLDVDGDGSNVTIFSQTFYLWDRPIWTNGSLMDTLGYFVGVRNGITIDVAEIELLQYIGLIFPGVSIPGWLATLNLVLAVNIYPVVYQLLFLEYQGTAVNYEMQDDGIYGFTDKDTTDSLDIVTQGKVEITPLNGSSYSMGITPYLYTYAFTEITGTLNLELEILGIPIFEIQLINLASSQEDSYSIVSYPSESFTRTTNLVNSSILDVALKWSFDTGSAFGIVSSPIYADLDKDGNLEILFGARDNYVYCLDQNGSVQWSYDTGGWSRDLTIADLDNDGYFEVIFSNSAFLRCLNYDGTYRWTYSTSGVIYSAPCIADLDNDGNLEIIITSQINKVFCLNSTGDLIWDYTTGGLLETSVAVADLDNDEKLEIIFGSMDGNLYCLNYSGQFNWNYPTGGSIRSSPSIADLDQDGTFEIIFGSDDNNIYCLDHLGASEWFYTTSDDVHSSPGIADINNDSRLDVIIGSNDNNVYCLLDNGTLLWSFATNDDVVCPPSIADLNNDGYLEVLVGSYDSKLYCINYRGLKEWSFLTNNSLQSTPCIVDLDSDGLLEIIVVSWDGFLYCLELTNATSSGEAPWSCFHGSIFHTGQMDSDSDFLDDQTEKYYLTNENNNDTDSDLFIDGWEIFLGTDPLNTTDNPHTDFDMDFDGLTNGEEFNLGTDPYNPDSDFDNMPDGWEVTNSLNPLVNDSSDDPDFDGLSNLEEYLHLTEAFNNDTDSDGMPDGWEVANSLNPILDDSTLDPDLDTLTNLEEFNLDTNPQSADTDSDGMPDDWEVVNGLDPLINDASSNEDSDGLTNLQEYQNDTDPNDSDTDSDSMPDGWEVANSLDPLLNDANEDPDLDTLTNLEEYTNNTDPNDSDTDDDLMPDAWEVANSLDPLVDDASSDADSDSLTNYNEYLQGTDPQDSDSDDDLMPDGWEVTNTLNPLVDDAASDPDLDTLNNYNEYLAGTDPNDSDSDDDLMPDAWEVANSLNPLIDDAVIDTDSDELSNYNEYLQGTDPNDSDSDDDLIPDGWEVNSGLDPLVDDAGDNDDSDSLDNLEEYYNDTDPFDSDTDDDGLYDDVEVTLGTDPNLVDTDGDLLDDYTEVYDTGTDPLDSDSDDDTIDDFEETVAGSDGFITDPNDADTDGDGFDDGAEVLAGTDPTDSEDYPGATTPPTTTPTTPTDVGSLSGGLISLTLLFMLGISTVVFIQQRKK